MEKRFGKIYPCIKELKKRWRNKWKVILNEAAPMLFYKHPECLGLNKYLLLHIKGDKVARLDMVKMVKDADSIYIATKEDGKYYLAYDVENIEEISVLQSLEVEEIK